MSEGRINPRDFQTFDKFDSSIAPPEVPEEHGDDPEVRDDVLTTGVGVLVAAYNRR